MRFEEAWLFLQRVGFQRVGYDEFFYDENDRAYRSRRHQTTFSNVERLVSDSHIWCPPRDWKYEDNSGLKTDWITYHEPPPKLKRDKSIKIKSPRTCVRCGSKTSLEREHIVALKDGGKDESSNLQWMCRKCHDYKHAREKIVENLRKYKEDNWHHELWSYRLKVLDDLNPIEADSFTGYWKDPRTHWSNWNYHRRKQLKVHEDAEQTKLA